MANPFVHVELSTNDLTRAKEFYSKLFDWKLQEVRMPGAPLPGVEASGGTYTMIEVGGGTGGGMMTNPMPGTPSHWLAYVGVDDINASTKKAKELGAKVLVDVMEVGEFGWMSVIADPTGATLAMWKAKGH
jgi:predicted enzyme related to lactoylglutathione lyase